jgi:fructose-bisphosphate aldolase class II
MIKMPAIKRGVAKINVDTELRHGFIKGVRGHWAERNDFILADVNSSTAAMKACWPGFACLDQAVKA